MTKKWIGLLASVLLTIMPAGSLRAALDEGNFVPCCSDVAAAVGKAVYYSVQPGDTLWSVSRKYNVNLEQLQAANNLADCRILTIGYRLLIPAGVNPIHVVKKGETLWDIAAACGVELQQIYALNPGIDAQKLKVGDSLTLPGGSTAVARYSVQPSRGLVDKAVYAFFSWPVVGVITSAYGWRSRGFHHGLDIAARIGDPVKAAASGTVSFAGAQGVYGNLIVIDHPGGRQTAYAHLSRINVTKGSPVSRGQVIGKVGVTGNSTGPHLHFEIRVGKKTVNPVTLLR